MNNRRPSIFRASEVPANFPFDISIDDDYSGDQECPACLKPLADHTDRQLVNCALKRVRNEKG